MKAVSPALIGWQSRCYGLSQLWERAADPFPWSLSCLVLCVQLRWGEIELVCSPPLRRVFLHSLSLSFSPLVESCSRWGDTAQHAATGGPGNLCPLSKNMFWPSVPHLEGYLLLKPFFLCSHMTQCHWQDIFAHSVKAKHIFFKWNKIETSCVVVMCKILLRGILALPGTQSGAIFSRPFPKQKAALWRL